MTATFGRLVRKESPQPMSDINMTPLVDVMLVLVVILIVTAPLLAQSIKMNLPKATVDIAQTASKFIAIDVDASGQMYADARAVSRDELLQALRSASARSAETEVRLRADAALPYGSVVDVMGLAHQAGLYRIGFVAEASRP